jgi:hypothetical protein
VLTAAEANRVHGDATRSQLRCGRAVDAAEVVAPRGSEPSSSDDDGCSSEDEQRRSSTRKNIPWDPIDEQRLLVYKKEGKSWDWIFGKFEGRTKAAIRTS